MADLNEILARLKDLEDSKSRMEVFATAAAECNIDIWAARRIADIDRPTYVEQLRYIESPDDDILRAVKEHAKGRASRLEWYENGYIKETDVLAYEQHFIDQHKDIFSRPVVPGEADKDRGQETLRQCRVNGHAHQLKNSQPYSGFSEGTLHKLSDSKVIGWHPKWKEHFCAEGES